MKLISSNDIICQKFLTAAALVAKKATCQRRKCGSIIVKDEEIIGKGWNSPPNNDESQRRCKNDKDKYHKKVTDKTCCIHAEERAVMDALAKHPDKIKGSRLYFTSIDEQGNVLFSGKAYCTSCSKTALDAGVSEFVLYREEGFCVFDTVEYNNLSYQYSG